MTKILGRLASSAAVAICAALPALAGTHAAAGESLELVGAGAALGHGLADITQGDRLAAANHYVVIVGHAEADAGGAIAAHGVR